MPSTLRDRAFATYDTFYLRANGLRANDPRTWERFRPVFRASLAPFVEGLPPDARIADVGCGIGILLDWLSVDVPGATLVGVDRSAGPLALARGRLAPEIALHEARADQFLRAHPASFDRIFCDSVLEHVAGEDELLAIVEAARGALRPGGLFIASVPNGASLMAAYTRYLDLTHTRAFTSFSLQHLFELAGFTESFVHRPRGATLRSRIRSGVEHQLHRLFYRICGVSEQDHFSSFLTVAGRAA